MQRNTNFKSSNFSILSEEEKHEYIKNDITLLTERLVKEMSGNDNKYAYVCHFNLNTEKNKLNNFLNSEIMQQAIKNWTETTGLIELTNEGDGMKLCKKKVGIFIKRDETNLPIYFSIFFDSYCVVQFNLLELKSKINEILKQDISYANQQEQIEEESHALANLLKIIPHSQRENKIEAFKAKWNNQLMVNYQIRIGKIKEAARGKEKLTREDIEKAMGTLVIKDKFGFLDIQVSHSLKEMDFITESSENPFQKLARTSEPKLPSSVMSFFKTYPKTVAVAVGAAATAGVALSYMFRKQ